MSETEMVLRELIGIVFFVTAAVFGLLAYYVARSARATTGSWRPWPATLEWLLAALFVALTISYAYPGIESLLAKAPLDWGRGLFALIVMAIALALWRRWAKEE